VKLQKSGRLQLVVAGAIVAAAVATWMNRDRVDAAASAVLGISKADETRSGGRGRRKGASRRPLPVVVGRVSEGRNDVLVEAIGTARARQSVTLYAPVAGEIVSTSARAGRRVAKGETIFELDSKKAHLLVNLARSRLLDAERKLRRSEQLKRRRVNSDATVDDARTAFERAQLGLDQAQETLRDLTIRAPFAGVLGIAKVEVGDRVTTTTALVALDDRSELLVEFEVPERYMPRLKPGQTVEARTPGYPRQPFAGTIRGIDSRIDPVARTVIVRAAIPNPVDKLRPGMSFAVQTTLAGKPYPKIPELALQFSQAGNFVWRIDGHTARRINVTLVRRLDEYVLVSGDLKPGALVVVEGVQRLKPGRKVSYGAPPGAAADGDRRVRVGKTTEKKAVD
jgi:RND family efflux transporter MFP subunit